MGAHARGNALPLKGALDTAERLVGVTAEEHLENAFDLIEMLGPAPQNEKPQHAEVDSSLPEVQPVPNNPYLAQSPWPAPHRTGYAQGSSPYEGIDSTDCVKHDILRHPLVSSNPINLFYTEDEKYLWGSSWTTIFKVRRTEDELQLADFYPRNFTEVFHDVFHGAYSVLSRDGTFFTAAGNRIEAYRDRRGRRGVVIEKAAETFALPAVAESLTTPPPHVIRALCMTWDGYLIFTTAKGMVGAVSSDLAKFEAPAALFDLGVDTEVEITNNIACDEDGGIVSMPCRRLVKMQWDASQLEMTKVWETMYESDEGEVVGARLGHGSGSTPSIIGDAEVGRFVVITDGRRLMRVVAIDADTGEYLDEMPVTFGDEKASFTASEQSILVHDWRFVVVNNTPQQSPLAGVSEFASNTPMASIAKAWPVILGQAPTGVEQFEFSPHTRRIRRTWVNMDVSIPNGIPTMSAPKGLMYGIGKRVLQARARAGPFRGSWTVEALDWVTGRTRFYYVVGPSILNNSIYAATQVGDKELLSGTGGGILRLRQTC